MKKQNEHDAHSALRATCMRRLNGTQRAPRTWSAVRILAAAALFAIIVAGVVKACGGAA